MISSKKLCVIMIMFVSFMVVTSQKLENDSVVTEVFWPRLRRIAVGFLQNCWLQNVHVGRQKFTLLRDCFKSKILTVLNRILQCDLIELFDGVHFVKIKGTKEEFSREMDSVDNLQEKYNWTNLVMNRITKIFETHMFKVRLDSLLRGIIENNEARRRHKRGNMMMSLLMFGLIAMKMLLIPMGFKFLTVLGAKALLLAKMALILTSIHGLKKLATSGLNYGFYHSHPHETWHHDRYGLEDVPDEQLDFVHHKHMRS